MLRKQTADDGRRRETDAADAHLPEEYERFEAPGAGGPLAQQDLGDSGRAVQSLRLEFDVGDGVSNYKGCKNI